MKDLLLKYMSHFPNDIKKNELDFGPVITISREYGCYGSGLAKNLTDRINNEFSPDSPWKTVDRHVLSKVSTELHADPVSISHVFGAEQKGFLADIIDSFSPKNYTSDNRVINTIKKVVRNFAEEGNTVIVGRAGCIIASHIPRSLHVRIIASFEDRLASVMAHLSMSEKEAKRHIESTSKRREQFMRFFKGMRPDAELFDIVFNKSRMNEDAIVQGILCAAKSKQIV